MASFFFCKFMQARYWILTIKKELFQDANQFKQLLEDTPQLTFVKGQLEIGANSDGTMGEGSSKGPLLRTGSLTDGSGDKPSLAGPLQLHNGPMGRYCNSGRGVGSISGDEGTLSRVYGGFEHWQVIAYFKSRIRLATVKSIFGQSVHAEPTRSDAAEAYVWKDETAVVGTRFSFGTKPRSRCNDKDWASIKSAAQHGRLDDIPPDVYCRNYNTLKRIAVDHMAPVAIERTIVVYWGTTGVGKSRLAWEQAGLQAYPKDPRSKFWDGYSNQPNVVIDEFRGGIDISHILRWFDRYPVIVEVKGSSTVLSANKIWITSNLHPRLWYPDIDGLTFDALMRRLKVYEMFPDGSMIEEI